MMTDDQSATAFRSQLVALHSDIAMRAFDSLGSEVTAAYRWIYATAVVLNSGALFLTFTLDREADRMWLGAAHISFSFGIFAAVFLAYLTIQRSQKARGEIRVYLFHILHEQHGFEPPADMSFDPTLTRQLERGGRISVGVGWVAVLAFFFGLVSLWFALL
jgi:hypothetical protein